MKAEIKSRFEKNLGRVKQLIDIYQQRPARGSGRRSVKDEDILRAATVFLHASLEDLVRSIEEWRLPLAEASKLASVPLPGADSRAEKFNLASVAHHRGKSVQKLIEESVSAHLARKSYSDVGQIISAFAAAGIRSEVLEPHRNELAQLIQRRHNIVHRTDRLDQRGKGHRGTQSIGTDAVNRWLAAVEAFGRDVLAAL